MDAGCGIISFKDGSEAVVVAGGRNGSVLYSSSEIFFYEKSDVENVALLKKHVLWKVRTTFSIL